MTYNLHLLIIRPEFCHDRSVPDLISELLRGMRLSGVKYRRIEASAPFGVAFHRHRAKHSFILSASAAPCCVWRVAQRSP